MALCYVSLKEDRVTSSVSVSIEVSISACHIVDRSRETGVRFPDRELSCSFTLFCCPTPNLGGNNALTTLFRVLSLRPEGPFTFVGIGIKDRYKTGGDSHTTVASMHTAIQLGICVRSPSLQMVIHRRQRRRENYHSKAPFSQQ
jgi:hypothetical protein